jgi:hypothetical protein
MPLIAVDRAQKTVPLWEKTLKEQIRTGQAIPLISSKVIHDLFLGGQADLVRDYADYVRRALPVKDTGGVRSPSGQAEGVLPFPCADYIKYLLAGPDEGDPAPLRLDGDDLLQLARFKRITDEQIKSDASLQIDYLDFIKNRFFYLARDQKVPDHLLKAVETQFDHLKFSEFPDRLGFPNFEGTPEHPLLILAGFPFRIYLTTSHHNFVEMALRAAGKAPRMEFCRWHPGLEELVPSVFETDSVLEPGKRYQPTDKEPLVYHLFGHDDHLESLVLTDDDYLRFLIAISQNRGQNTDPIPKQVRGAMAYSALILLGYELHSWDFRVLFWGVIKTEAMNQVGVSIQVKRSQLEQKYFERYLQTMANCEVFWGGVEEYTRYLLDEVRV